MEGEASRNHCDKDVCKRLWKMKVAPAVKFFVWRACSEALPTCANLKRRKVIEDPLYPICRIELETSSHALWRCSPTRDMWSKGCIKVQKMSYQNDLFFNIWMSLVQQLDRNDLEEVAVTLKGIWTRRNEFMHGKGFRHPTSISQTTRIEVVSFNEANQSHQPNLIQSNKKELKWQKPAAGLFKANCDAALSFNTSRMGMGVIIRDHNGWVMGALRASRVITKNPLVAEAQDLLLAAVICKEIGLKQLILEGDSKQVIDLLQKEGSNWSKWGMMIEDARQILNTFSQWTGSHECREANMVAHYLAKSALNFSVDLYDIEECPFCIQSIVATEML